MQFHIPHLSTTKVAIFGVWTNKDSAFHLKSMGLCLANHNNKMELCLKMTPRTLGLLKITQPLFALIALLVLSGIAQSSLHLSIFQFLLFVFVQWSMFRYGAFCLLHHAFCKEKMTIFKALTLVFHPNTLSFRLLHMQSNIQLPNGVLTLQSKLKINRKLYWNILHCTKTNKTNGKML